MDISLYNRIRAVANPFEYEEYRKKKLKERLDAKRSSRIAPKNAKKKKTSVNPDLAERLLGKAEASKTKGAKLAGQLLSDDRFGSLFTNTDYEINEEDEDFKLRNPSGVALNKRNERNDMDSDDDDEMSVEDDNAGVFRRVDSAEEDDEGSHDSADSDSDDDDGFRGGKVCSFV
jgi:ribosome biogenesis protein ENP2